MRALKGAPSFTETSLNKAKIILGEGKIFHMDPKALGEWKEKA